MNDFEGFKQVCETEFYKLNDKLDMLDILLRGNGKIGLVTRMDRLEVAAVSRGRWFWLILGIVSTLIIGTVWRFIGGAV